MFDSVTVRRIRTAIVAAVFAALALGGTAVASAQSAPSPTNPSGFVRVGHLAADVGPVDVYLSSAADPQPAVLPKAPYGAFTAYQTLAPGEYTVSMRPAGSPAAAAPMLTTTVTVAKGAAYTVLATGPANALKTSVINDDLTPPAPNVSRVRLVQGSVAAQNLTVQAVGGPTLARNVSYGSATGYADVPQGRWTLRVTAGDGSNAMASSPTVDLRAGSVNSLIVTDAPGGGFAVTAVVDAAGINAAMAPAGGVETGGGGSAAGTSGAAWAWVLGIGGAALAVAFGLVGVPGRTVTVRS